MALGADRNQVMRLVVGRGLVVGIAGVAAGVPAAFAVTRLMRNLLSGVTTLDPVVFICVPLLLLLIAALASYVPARKAMRVDPMVGSGMSDLVVTKSQQRVTPGSASRRNSTSHKRNRGHYGTGLRRAELRRLRGCEIDSRRMIVQVH